MARKRTSKRQSMLSGAQHPLCAPDHSNPVLSRNPLCDLNYNDPSSYATCALATTGTHNAVHLPCSRRQSPPLATAATRPRAAIRTQCPRPTPWQRYMCWRRRQRRPRTEPGRVVGLRVERDASRGCIAQRRRWCQESLCHRGVRLSFPRPPHR